MGKEKTPRITRKDEIISAFHKDYFHTLMGLAMYLALDENDADEIVACTYAKTCKWSLEKLEDMLTWEKPIVLAYLSKTLSNTHKDIQRKIRNQKKIEKRFCENKEIRFEHSPESTFISSENIRFIKKAYYDAIEEEPKIVRVAFYLKTNRGLKNKEIANRLNVSPSTLGTKIHRLRKKIKEKII